MNELDQFVKHCLKVKYYIRYADDFVIISENEQCLENLLLKIQLFLSEKLKLRLHPNKITIRKLRQGIDFLGYIVLPHYRLVRTKTKRRIFKRVNPNNLSSYTGLLSHCNAYKLTKKVILFSTRNAG